jgi:hypothetical protein
LFQCFQNRVLGKCPKAVAHHSKIRLQCGLSLNEREAVAKMRAEGSRKLQMPDAWMIFHLRTRMPLLLVLPLSSKVIIFCARQGTCESVLFGDCGPGG